MQNKKRILLALLTAWALLSLSGCGRTEPVPAPTEAPTAAPSPVPTEEAEPAEAGTPASESAQEESPLAERLANAQRQIRTQKTGQYGMTPIYGRDVADGTYPIHVDSSSPFFRIAQAELIVKDGEMLGRITIPSMSYLYVYPGSARQAGKADTADWLGYEEVDGHTVFTLPVEMLDAPVECAAYSRAREKWYDRKLVFYASSLPEDALAFQLPDYDLIEAAIRSMEADGLEEYLNVPVRPTSSGATAEPIDFDMPDGEYSIEVNMTGGSGRASISSPTLLIVREGKGYARLLWSSAYYDYMVINGEVFDNLTTDGGNSVFEIPITAVDDAIPVVADTTAMGDPLEIEYTLTFYSDNVGSKSQIPQEAAKKVLIIAGAVIVAGGVLNYFVKKKRQA